MILPCHFSSLLRKINLDHAFKPLFVKFSMIWAPAPKHAPRHPQFCIKKPLEGWQNSRVPRWFSLFGNVADFATPPYVFKVFRSPFWPLWAPTSHNSMISLRNVTFFAYKYKPDLDPKGEVRKGHAKGSLNHYHLCTFACENHKNAPSRKDCFTNGISMILGLLFANPPQNWFGAVF